MKCIERPFADEETDFISLTVRLLEFDFLPMEGFLLNAEPNQQLAGTTAKSALSGYSVQSIRLVPTETKSLTGHRLTPSPTGHPVTRRDHE